MTPPDQQCRRRRFGRAKLKLADRVIVITGGASGIGLQTAREVIARSGFAVLVDLDSASPANVARKLGDRALGVVGDVTDPAALAAALDQVATTLGGIDVVIANAGIGPVSTMTHAGDWEHQQRVLEVNLIGDWNTVRAGAPHVLANRGHIEIISSVAAFIPCPTCSAYAVSKAGVEQLARCLRMELAPLGVSVGVAHFGLVDTPLVHEFFTNDATAQVLQAMPSWLLRAASVEKTASALVADIEHRSPRTIYPRYYRLAYALRGMFAPLADASIARGTKARATMNAVMASDVTGSRS